MKGQTSIELVLIISISILLAMMVLGKFTGLQESVFTAASTRSQLITEIEKLNTKYDVKKVDFAECPENIRLNITIKPDPAANGDDLSLSAKLKDAVKTTRNLGAKTVCVAYNNPTSLLCGQPCSTSAQPGILTIYIDRVGNTKAGMAITSNPPGFSCTVSEGTGTGGATILCASTQLPAGEYILTLDLGKNSSYEGGLETPCPTLITGVVDTYQNCNITMPTGNLTYTIESDEP